MNFRGAPAAWAIAAFAALLGGATSAKTIAPNPIGASAVWDDGRAEISIYDTWGPKYGVERRYETRMIVVKEDVRIDDRVKSDAGPIPGRTRESLKLLVQHDIPTGTYTYHQSASIYLYRRNLAPYSLVMNSIDGCGLTSALVHLEGDQIVFRGNSYWEGEAERDTAIVMIQPDILFYDALPLGVRGMRPESAGRFTAPLLPTQISNHLIVPTIDSAEVTIRSLPPDTVLVTVAHAAGEDRFWIGTLPERPLLRWEKADGSVLVLRKRLRLAYWEHTKPGDEELLR